MVAPSAKKRQDADVISVFSDSVVASPSDSMAIVHLLFFLPYTVTHICRDMTGLAILAGRLDTRTFCLPLVGVACHGAIA
jgi:F420-0:gamma-glutamyl ligase-like protein